MGSGSVGSGSVGLRLGGLRLVLRLGGPGQVPAPQDPFTQAPAQGELQS